MTSKPTLICSQGTPWSTYTYLFSCLMPKLSFFLKYLFSLSRFYSLQIHFILCSLKLNKPMSSMVCCWKNMHSAFLILPTVLRWTCFNSHAPVMVTGAKAPLSALMLTYRQVPAPASALLSCLLPHFYLVCIWRFILVLSLVPGTLKIASSPPLHSLASIGYMAMTLFWSVILWFHFLALFFHIYQFMSWFRSLSATKIARHYFWSRCQGWASLQV